MNSSRQIKLGAVLSYLGIIVNILVGLLYTPWMIHKIGKADYGLYTLTLSIISFFVCDFGLSAAVARFVAKYLAENNKQKVQNFLGIVTKLYVYIDVAVFLILASVYFFLPTIYQRLTLEEIEKFKVLYVIASSFSIVSFPFIPLNGIISAFEDFVDLQLCNLFNKIFTVTCLIVCLKVGLGLYSLVLVNAVSGIVTIILKLIVVRKRLSLRVNWSFYDHKILMSVLYFSGWTTVIVLCQRCIFNIAPTILGHFANSESIAVLGVAISLEAYTYLYANALNGMFLPKVSRLIYSKQEILPLMIKVGRIQILLIGIIFIGFALVGRHFVQLWLGDGFDSVFICTLLLILPSFISLPQEIAEQAIIAENKVKHRAVVFGVMALINVILSIILTRIYGVVGVAVSIFFSYMLRVIAMNYIYWKILGINIFLFFKESFGKMMPGLLTVLILCYGINYMLPPIGLVSFLIKVVIMSVLYIVLMYYMVLNENEKSLISNLINNIKKRIKK